MRKEVPIRNNPGITKILKFDERSVQWKDSGKFRAVRRVGENGERDQGVFINLEDARAFRRGNGTALPEKEESPLPNQVIARFGITFSELVIDWKKIHYLQLEKSSQQMYEC